MVVLEVVAVVGVVALVGSPAVAVAAALVALEEDTRVAAVRGGLVPVRVRPIRETPGA